MLRFAQIRRPLPSALVLYRRCKSVQPDAENVSKALPGVELARRAVDPSAQFPTTWSDTEPLPATDPRICWREHYSLEKSQPYYENVTTGEVSWEIPDGFVTRFPKLYANNGFTMDEKGAVSRRDGSNEVVGKPGGEPPVSKKPLTLKQKLAAYGGGGLLWYLIVHNVCLFSIFCCLYFLRIDLVSIARSYGFKIKQKEEVEVVTPTKSRPPFWKTFLFSIVFNKMFVPLQLVFTVATAPLLVHRLEPVARALFPKFKAFVHNIKSRFA
ncbi:hypothetical protein AGDE_02853 [Angomonas deanei]|uniref:WW domain-containing protein n=1 Tax=Angomonas deanei TaxID=59799 RepID=A0A7G2C9I7_9TRYP|nr:hypothetical protein AGDE_02853 [Angomonas deanei]CAD2216406.1 hypothetical protein, conserved [Angomonas deanei]|eukprot:EPY41072.1 hypothetical protein AGDE_02853 [Angomonas deanei]